VTTNMRNAAEQAAYEFGRAAAKYEMAIGTASGAVEALPHGATVTGLPGGPHTIVSNGSRKRVAKTTSNPRSSTRGKGVKARIASMISTAPLTVAEIIAHTGFKKTSVRATLASLKKEGLAIQEGNAWLYDRRPRDTGNSEAFDAASNA
jgi:predicted Rossmann fold nucleotide-binding protein DprA/Smf involved in DNA uptake